MRKFEFKPGQYEWHLTDKETGKILHNMVDPIEELYDENGMPLSLEETINLCFSDLDCADSNYAENEAYNGILLEGDDTLSLDEMERASKIMGQILYDYYIN